MTDRRRWAIDDVLDRTDLAALLDELDRTRRPTTRPGPQVALPRCPYHDDHRASVTMFRDRHGHERWRCWSGDHRGDAIDLVIAVTGRDRADAIDWLATRAGMIPDRPLPPLARPKPSTAHPRRRWRWTRSSPATSTPVTASSHAAQRHARCATGCTPAGSTTPRSPPT